MKLLYRLLFLNDDFMISANDDSMISVGTLSQVIG
jgi:hypothetical protein